MTLSNLHGPLLAVCLMAGAAAFVQAGSSVERADGPADPLNAKAAVPPARYASPFADYQAAGEIKRSPWRAANDTVARTAGGRGHAHETHPPVPAANTPASGAAPRPAGHGTH